MKSLSVTPEDAGADCYGKPASELQENIRISGTKITGSLNWVTGYTKFSSDTAQQSGNFLALKVSAPGDATVKFKLVGGSSPEKKLPADDHQIVWKIGAKTQKPHIEITRGGHTGTQEYDLSGLELKAAGG